MEVYAQTNNLLQKERLLEHGYRIQNADEWLGRPSIPDQEKRSSPTRKTLMNAQLDVYTLWTLRLKELIDERGKIDNLSFDELRYYYLVWRPSIRPKDCFVALKDHPKAALSMCAKEMVMRILRDEIRILDRIDFARSYYR